MLRTSIVCVVLLLHFPFSQLYDGKYEGDNCELQDGKTGKCVPLHDCESAIELVYLRQHPKTCSFVRFTPIVCCPVPVKETSETTQETSETTQGTIKTRLSELKCQEYQKLNFTLGNKFVLPPTEINTQTSTEITLDIRKPLLNLSSQNLSPDEPVTVFLKLNYTEDTSKKVQDPLNVSVSITKDSNPTEEINIQPLSINTESRNIDTNLSNSKENKTIVNEELIQSVNDDKNSDTNNFKDDFSHIAALGYPNGSKILWNCTGILVSKNFILTAGHCLNLPDLGAPEHVSLAYLPRLLPILNSIAHPSYKPPSLYHNIALIKFSYPLKFTISVRPACLYSFEQDPIQLSQVAGYIEELMDVSVNIIPVDECKKTYQEIGNRTDVDGIICGKYTSKDSCYNNTYGGPLQLKVDSGNSIPVYNIIGVTSNIVTCILDVPLPIVYVRISHYISWLESVIWPNE